MVRWIAGREGADHAQGSETAPGFAPHAALVPPGLGAEPHGVGRRLGKFHGHSSDFSMKQKYYNLARKAKVLPEENIGKKELFFSCDPRQKHTVLL